MTERLYTDLVIAEEELRTTITRCINDANYLRVVCKSESATLFNKMNAEQEHIKSNPALEQERRREALTAPDGHIVPEQKIDQWETESIEEVEAEDNKQVTKELVSLVTYRRDVHTERDNRCMEAMRLNWLTLRREFKFHMEIAFLANM